MNKKYILIQNEGEIETNSFELIGASTKRDEKGKIGFFGSGLKYSIAYMMRKGIDFRVFSGLQEIQFTTLPEKLKDKTFSRICINGNPTSYTTTMGPTWTEDWFVLREIYCNGLDEGHCILVKEIEQPQPTEGKTRIFVELTEPLREVIAKWDSYFADERTPLFVTEKLYTCYLGSEEDAINQAVTVYAKTEGCLYRKGIVVHRSDRRLYDYGFDGVNINEDRTAKSPSGLLYAIRNMFATFCNEGFIKSVLRTGQDDIIPEEYASLSSNDYSARWSDKWTDFGSRHILAVKEVSGRYAKEINAASAEVFLVPYTFAKELKKNFPDIPIIGMGKMIDGSAMDIAEATPKMEFLLSQVLASLKEMHYEIIYPISIVDFHDTETLGRAYLGHIYLSKKVFDMGRREIALTLMEETEHIISRASDETRRFQSHIFSQWLKTMEEANGLFL